MITSRDKRRGLKEANKIFKRRADEENDRFLIFLIVVLFAWIITVVVW